MRSSLTRVLRVADGMNAIRPGESLRDGRMLAQDEVLGKPRKNVPAAPEGRQIMPRSERTLGTVHEEWS